MPLFSAGAPLTEGSLRGHSTPRGRRLLAQPLLSYSSTHFDASFPASMDSPVYSSPAGESKFRPDPAGAGAYDVNFLKSVAAAISAQDARLAGPQTPPGTVVYDVEFLKSSASRNSIGPSADGEGRPYDSGFVKGVAKASSGSHAVSSDVGTPKTVEYSATSPQVDDIAANGQTYDINFLKKVANNLSGLSSQSAAVSVATTVGAFQHGEGSNAREGKPNGVAPRGMQGRARCDSASRDDMHVEMQRGRGWADREAERYAYEEQGFPEHAGHTWEYDSDDDDCSDDSAGQGPANGWNAEQAEAYNNKGAYAGGPEYGAEYSYTDDEDDEDEEDEQEDEAPFLAGGLAAKLNRNFSRALGENQPKVAVHRNVEGVPSDSGRKLERNISRDDMYLPLQKPSWDGPLGASIPAGVPSRVPQSAPIQAMPPKSPGSIPGGLLPGGSTGKILQRNLSKDDMYLPNRAGASLAHPPPAPNGNPATRSQPLNPPQVKLQRNFSRDDMFVSQPKATWSSSGAPSGAGGRLAGERRSEVKPSPTGPEGRKAKLERNMSKDDISVPIHKPKWGEMPLRAQGAGGDGQAKVPRPRAQPRASGRACPAPGAGHALPRHSSTGGEPRGPTQGDYLPAHHVVDRDMVPKAKLQGVRVRSAPGPGGVPPPICQDSHGMAPGQGQRHSGVLWDSNGYGGAAPGHPSNLSPPLNCCTPSAPWSDVRPRGDRPACSGSAKDAGRLGGSRTQGTALGGDGRSRDGPARDKALQRNLSKDDMYVMVLGSQQMYSAAPPSRTPRGAGNPGDAPRVRLECSISEDSEEDELAKFHRERLMGQTTALPTDKFKPAVRRIGSGAGAPKGVKPDRGVKSRVSKSDSSSASPAALQKPRPRPAPIQAPPRPSAVAPMQQGVGGVWTPSRVPSGSTPRASAATPKGAVPTPR